MTKTKFTFQILKYTGMIDTIIRAICSHNEGKVALCREDFISYAQFYCAIWPSLYSGSFYIETTDEPGELRMTEDGGKTWSMLIQENEIHELTTESTTTAPAETETN